MKTVKHGYDSDIESVIFSLLLIFYRSIISFFLDTMAEAFPENIPSASDAQENFISILILATKWQFDTNGLSTVNKSLVNNLRVVDPEGKKIKITCAIVEEDENIKGDQREDVAKKKVELRGGKPPRGAKMKTKPEWKPSVEWLDQNIATYYPDLRKDSYDFIIGHAPYLANGPLNLRDQYPEMKPKPKVILIIHDIPKTSDRDVDEDTLLEWLVEVDIVFSVGKAVESEIIPFITSLAPEQRPTHKLYIPSYPLELFNTPTGYCGKKQTEGSTICNTDDGRAKRFRNQWTRLRPGCVLGCWSVKTHPRL